jgi:hypothetical protein
MTTIDTTATLTPGARALLGCPPWCTVDHLDGPMTAPGEHVRELARLGKDHSVDLGACALVPTPTVNINLGGNLSVELSATREVGHVGGCRPWGNRNQGRQIAHLSWFGSTMRALGVRYWQRSIAVRIGSRRSSERCRWERAGGTEVRRPKSSWRRDGTR